MSSASFLNHFFENFCPENSALLTAEGEVLHIKSDCPISYGTLGTATQTVAKYLPLKTGEVAVLNDPYSGGSTLNEFTFVTKLYDGAQALWLAERHRLGTPVTSPKTIEEEGLRIPPTPIYQGKQFNQMILGAMAHHPLCPAGFAQWIEPICKNLESLTQKFATVLQRHKISISKNSLKEYLDISRSIVSEKISEASSGDTRAEVFLDNNELIRLHMEIHEGQVRMDFSGTSPSKTQFLTESATYGICLHAIANFYGFHSLINNGSFAVLQVTKPTGCMLTAKYPAPLSAGALSVQAALQTVIALALAAIHAKKKKAICSFCPVEIEFKSTTGSTSMLRLPGGSGACNEGSPSIFALGETLAESFSIERLEREWPVRIHRMDYRNALQGRSDTNGGRGLSLRIEALNDLQIQWRTDLTLHKVKVPRNSSLGDHAEINLVDKNQSTKNLGPAGNIQLKAGESLTICSGTGGGWTS